MKQRELSNDQRRASFKPGLFSLIGKPGTNTRSFTLIELMMSIAIISILASMLLPVVNNVRKKAKFTRWIGIRECIRKEPDCVAYYVFSEDYLKANNQLQNLATFTSAENYGKLFKQEKTAATFNNSKIGSNYGRFLGYGGMNVNMSGHVGPDHSNSFDLTDQVSLEVWFKANQDAGCQAVLLGKGQSGFNYCYQLNYQGSANDDDTIKAQLKNSTGGTFSLSTTKFSLDDWHHCMFTFDGTTAKIFLDGEKCNESDAFAGKKIHNEGSASSISIGGPNDGGWSFGNSPMGFVSEAAVYARALSESEVLAHYQGGKH